MREVILIKNGELALKGLNRSVFEEKLIKNIKNKLSDLGGFTYIKSQSTICAIPGDSSVDLDEATKRISKIFGIAAFSRACATEKDLQIIMKTCSEYLSDELSSAKTFKVEAKRADKKFPYVSPEICSETGAYILNLFPHLKVDVNNPDLTVVIEIRDKEAFIHGPQIKGAGGMPVGSNGRAALLISGGIDSPVAGWMMSKRGLDIIAIHFASPPYTSARSELKVKKLLEIISVYCGKIALFTVPFTEIQEQIKKLCPEDSITIIMRRYMMKISSHIAENQNCGALITGESVGQVASQTIQALACTDKASRLPVFRPCIGMDKNEIVEISRRINAFDTSILPYDDCCTVFTPKHPKTKPSLDYILDAEKELDEGSLIQNALAGIQNSLIY